MSRILHVMQVVDEHFTAIVKEVLAEMGGRLWRNREAACSALSDLMQVRQWGIPSIRHLRTGFIPEHDTLRSSLLHDCEACRSLLIDVMLAAHSLSSGSLVLAGEATFTCRRRTLCLISLLKSMAGASKDKRDCWCPYTSCNDLCHLNF